jgi:Na+-translocating ferredoxin:NAD+ oxidoreductase RnfC subunit
VGAGGGGFPTAVKFKTQVSLVIANAAECEPLLHKDKELLHHHSEPFLRGMRMAMEMVGAREGVIGIKEKYHDIIAALERQAPEHPRGAAAGLPTRRATSSSWCTWSPAA